MTMTLAEWLRLIRSTLIAVKAELETGTVDVAIDIIDRDLQSIETILKLEDESNIEKDWIHHC